ncbi:MAG: hypothetical protein K2X82_27405 [Gemmataceae bacterium]|nr:hypothetical protein [Gemmataceae bacterium]
MCLYVVVAVAAATVARPVRTADPAPPPRPAAVTVTSTTRPADGAFRQPSYGGWVTAVDRESIIVQGFDVVGIGGAIRTMSWDPDRCANVMTGWPLELHWVGGRKSRAVGHTSSRAEVVLTDWWGRRTVLRPADTTPRRFLAGLALADGQWEPGAQPAESYRLADVRVGDWVGLALADTDLPGQELYQWCARVSIERRPGGKVPPAPAFEPPAHNYRFHEAMQAQQDWEERRAPFPEKYHPGGNVPQVAPPPREARPKPPGR